MAIALFNTKQKCGGGCRFMLPNQRLKPRHTTSGRTQRADGMSVGTLRMANSGSDV